MSSKVDFIWLDTFMDQYKKHKAKEILHWMQVFF